MALKTNLLLASLAVGLHSTVRGLASPEPAPVQKPAGDYVVLLHGLGRSSCSMKRLEWALEREGYRVINTCYPSTRLSVQEAAECFLAPLLHQRTPDPKARIHFVTHSLGGIVLRQYLRQHRLANLGRVAMLAPPNQGSELTDKLKASCLYRFINGPSGQQLGTGISGLPQQLGPADFQLGIIAGDRSLNPVFSSWIPGPDDGKVSVQNTRLDGMQDFLVVHHSHTWIMWRQDVIRAAVRFLKTGQFAGPE